MAVAEFSFIAASDVKTFIDESSNTWDTLIETLIDSCTKYAMNYCGGRRFKAPAADETEYYDVDEYQKKIFLRSWPIKSITSVSYSNGQPFDNPTWTAYNAATDYNPNTRLGILTFASLPKGNQNIKVVYKGGYDGNSAVPEDLKLAMIEAVAEVLNKRKSQGISSESIGGGSITWAPAPALNAILDNYRRFL